jgi:hypothetical protein
MSEKERLRIKDFYVLSFMFIYLLIYFAYVFLAIKIFETVILYILRYFKI